MVNIGIIYIRKETMEGKESLERLFAQLSDEQKEQFRNCKDMDEVMKLADEENVELTDEQLAFLASDGCGECGARAKKCANHMNRPGKL